MLLYMQFSLNDSGDTVTDNLCTLLGNTSKWDVAKKAKKNCISSAVNLNNSFQTIL